MMYLLLMDGYSRVHVFWRGREHTFADAAVLHSPARLRAQIVDRAFGDLIGPVLAAMRRREQTRDALEARISELPANHVCTFLWRT
jgi:hypothetical protein